MAWTVIISIEISSSSGDSANWCEIMLRYGSYYWSPVLSLSSNVTTKSVANSQYSVPKMQFRNYRECWIRKHRKKRCPLTDFIVV